MYFIVKLLQSHCFCIRIL